MKNYGVCFDLDGVIINSEPAHELAFQKALSLHSIELSHEKYFNYFAGKSDRQGFEDFLKTSYQSHLEAIPSLLVDKTRFYTEAAPAKIKPYTTTIETIKELHTMQVKMALVTGSVQSEVMLAVKTFALEPYFDTIITADDVPRGKPSPLTYTHAAKNLNISPEFCVAVEDSPSGILSANRADMRSIAITTTHDHAVLNRASRVINLPQLQETIADTLKMLQKDQSA